MNRPDTAAGKFGRMLCGAAVLTTYADELGITEMEAMKNGPAISGGRMGTCGAVVAAEMVLEKQCPQKAGEVQKRFIAKHTTDQCRSLKGRDTGKVILPCRECIREACALLEDVMAEE